MRKQEKQRKKQEQDRNKAKTEEPPARPDMAANPDTEDKSSTLQTDHAAVEARSIKTLSESVDKLSLSKESETEVQAEAVETTRTAVVAEKTKEKAVNQGGEAARLKPVPIAGPTSDGKSKKDLSPEEQAAVKAAREAQKAAKAAAKAAATQKKAGGGPPGGGGKPDVTEVADSSSQLKKEVETANKVSEVQQGKQSKKMETEVQEVEGGGEGKSKAELKAERRAKQEAQRAAKSQVGNKALSQN